MTVKELIEALQKLPQDLPAWQGCAHCMSEVDKVQTLEDSVDGGGQWALIVGKF